jgi:hypothetical protein
MPRQATVSIENNFTKGLITEASGLNFPENACTETFDCEFLRTGEVERRPGIELEEDFDIHEIDDLDVSAITEYVWRAVGLDGEITFLAVQVGNVINFWQIDENGNASPNIKSFTVNLLDYMVNFQNPRSINVSFSSGNGQLFITHPKCDPIFVEYVFDTDTIIQKRIEIKIRDIDGVPNYARGTETLMDPNHRPSDNEFGSYQYYNLINRGWGEPRTVTWNRLFWGFTYPLAAWRHHPVEFVANALALFQAHLVYLPAIQGIPDPRKDWPSDSDQVELLKQPIYPQIDDKGNVVAPVPPPEAFSMLAADEHLSSNTAAPRGRFLYSPWFVDRQAQVEYYKAITDLLPNYYDGLLTNSIPVEHSGGNRPSQTAFFAGRVWYAGVDAPKYNTRIYFSRILSGNQHYAECYQQEDPSDSEAASNDLLPNDGGIIVIPDVSRVIRMVPMGSSLLIFATNGVWRVLGTSDGAGFTAIDYTITKISDYGAISPMSFVIADGVPFWWNSEGIWTIQSDGVQPPTAVCLTLPTIQGFFDDIPIESKRWVKGAYSKSDHKIQWLYRSTAPTNIQERYHYDRILNLRLDIHAFYPWTISDSCLYVSGVASLSSFGTAVSTDDVTDDGVVVTNGGDPVTTISKTTSDLATRLKFLVFNECGDVDTGSTPPTLTYDRAFYGTSTNVDFGGSTEVINRPAQNAVIKGEDGKYYLSASGVSSSTMSLVQYNSDGTHVFTTYDLTQFTLDMNNTLGRGFATFSFASKILAVPYTQYFYMMSGKEDGADRYIVAGLYKINSSGNIEFLNKALAWTCNFYQQFSFGLYGGAELASQDFETYAASPLDRPILFALNSAVSSSSFICRMPSVNTFSATSGTTVAFLGNLHTGFEESFPGLAGDTLNIPNRPFFLPNATGAKIYRYVDWATCYAHINNHNPANQSVVIDSFAPGHPSGFMMVSPIDAVNWTIADTSFHNSDGSNLVPFADVLLDRDGTDAGFASNDWQNDWQAPTHQYDPNTHAHYLVWNRVYRPTEANQTSIGTYRTVLVQQWNPASEVATSLTNASGGPFDTISDLASGARFGAYPSYSQAFMDVTSGDLFFFNEYGGFPTGTDFALAKFGTFTPGTSVIGTSNMSFAQFDNEDYIDWPGVTAGIDYTSYFTTGYKVRGEAIRKFQSNYLQLYTNNFRASTFDVHSKWDYSNTGNTGRWSSTQRVAMESSSYDYKTKRLKMRGHGKALQFKVASVDQEPFNIIGFSVYETANATV